jgi:hypothetical protein
MYRDADTYKHVVLAGSLYPLNALMLHGLIYAKHAKNLGTDPGNDFADEVHGYFGTGTQFQEMYITPSLLSNEKLGYACGSRKVVTPERGCAAGHALDRRRSGDAAGLWLGVVVTEESNPRAKKSQ